MNELLNTMMGKIAPGMCRISMYGGIAVKTGAGYRTYDPASGRLVNCENFVFPVGEEFFFVLPANRVRKGDIILAGGRPKYVLEAGKNRITALNYENGVIETILPERHIFMGNTYFYGKIVSMFGNRSLGKGKGPGRIMKYLMLSQMMKNQGGSSSLLPMMFLFGKGGFGMDEMFDLEEEEEDDVVITDEEEE